MTDTPALVAWARAFLADDVLDAEDGEMMAFLIDAAATAIPAAEHDRRVTELLAANNALLTRARRAEAALHHRRDRADHHTPPPTHRHYKGGWYRLLGVVWQEGSGELLFRYAGSGRQWARGAGEFLSCLDTALGLRRRYEPIDVPLSSVTVAGALCSVSLYEYRLIALATLTELGASAERLADYKGLWRWEEPWRTHVAPADAARAALETLRRAA